MGHSQRESLERVASGDRERQAEWALAQLHAHPCPVVLEYLRTLLYRLHGRSGAGMNGANALTPTTIRDYCALTGDVVEPWEVDALMGLDATLLNAAHAPERTKPPTKGAKGG